MFVGLWVEGQEYPYSLGGVFEREREAGLGNQSAKLPDIKGRERQGVSPPRWQSVVAGGALMETGST